MNNYNEYEICNGRIKKTLKSVKDIQEDELSIVTYDLSGNYQHSHHWTVTGFINKIFENEWLDESIYELYRMHGTDEVDVVNFIINTVSHWQVSFIERTIYTQFAKSIKLELYTFYVTKLAMNGYINGREIIQHHLQTR